ncbi:hypothetical protein [Streptomyces sp. NBC_00687]|nr:hypothetical protein [Streptomyces sp. NBC_00687]MCX4912433.1 hypothetical protein [Streptomyces sp. NBC_00687]
MRIWGARMLVAGWLGATGATGATGVLGGARSGWPSGGATSGTAR